MGESPNAVSALFLYRDIRALLWYDFESSYSNLSSKCTCGLVFAMRTELRNVRSKLFRWRRIQNDT